MNKLKEQLILLASKIEELPDARFQESLPETADGIPVLSRVQYIFHPIHGEGILLYESDEGDDVEFEPTHMNYVYGKVSECYSAKEKAEQAKLRQKALQELTKEAEDDGLYD